MDTPGFRDDQAAFLDALRSGVPAHCPLPHRPPEGPNEDVSVCSCGRMTFELRPEGETYGNHLPDCSLPIRHEGRCQPGGSGHPPARTIRGFWPGSDEAPGT